MIDDDLGLVDIHEDHAPTLYRLAAMLGADGHARNVVNDAAVSLERRRRRLVDPAVQREYLQERVVHQSRAVRLYEGRELELPEVTEPAQQRLLEALCHLPTRNAEVLVVSHLLQVFGVELAGIMRMPVRTTNLLLEDSLRLLARSLGRPAAASDSMDDLSRELTASLAAASRMIVPPKPEPAARTLTAIRAQESRRLPAWVLVPVVLLGLLVGGGLGVAAGGLRGLGPQGEPTVSSAPDPTPEESRSLPSQVRAVPVYYVGRTDGWLYRELRDLPAGGGVLEAALQAVVSAAPLDPDYMSAWGSGELRSATLEGGVLSVDLAPEAYQGLTPETAQQAADQMVYTATEVLGDAAITVRFLSDGAPVSTSVLPVPAEGHGRSGFSPMPPLWLTTPRNGAVMVAGTVAIAGTVLPGADAPDVTVTNADGVEVASATAQTATLPNREGWRVWSVSLQLPPGDYQVTAHTIRRGAGTDREESTETKTFTLE